MVAPPTLTAAATALGTRPSSQQALDELSFSLPDHPEYLQQLKEKVPSKYHDLLAAFSKTNADTLPPHRDFDHRIDLEPGTKPPFGPIYSLSEPELKALREWLDENLENYISRRSSHIGLMNHIFREILDIYVVVYLDDILVFSKNERDHEQHCREILRRLIHHHLYVKAEKCEFDCAATTFLGFTVSAAGIGMEDNKMRALLDWPPPTNLKELQALLGFANFYRRFIDGYSRLTLSLTRLTRKNTPFELLDTPLQAINELKAALTSAPLLQHFEPDLETIIETDASDFAISGILSQRQPSD
ncbi:unnamed protein product [Tilletia caries]|nr:unnamed protein product [Tilletia caries]